MLTLIIGVKVLMWVAYVSVAMLGIGLVAEEVQS